MRNVAKSQPEPVCLSDARRLARVGGRRVSSEDWDSVHGDCKGRLRERLFRDQKGLCAYCCDRLRGGHGWLDHRPDLGGMKIEHWLARSRFGEETLTWSNLLGVCGGRPSASSGSCDNARGNGDLRCHPVSSPSLHERFTYTATGEVRGRDADAAADIDLLNLNHPVLKAGRARVIEALRKALARDDRPGSIRRRLASLRQEDEHGTLPGFVQVAEHYLEKKLRLRDGR